MSVCDIETIKKEKKVGIIIFSGVHLFSNGLTQNAYYLLLCLEKVGFKCQFLCYSDKPVPFAHKSMSLKTISKDKSIFDPSEYSAIITVSEGITEDLFTILKEHKVAVAGLVCGSNIMMDQECFYDATAPSVYIGNTSKVDELWVIPSYKFMLDYLETIRCAPAYIVPHLWTPECVNELMIQHYKKSTDLLYYNITKRKSKKINIIIMEPNLFILKNAWLPIVAAEKLHKEHPELIEFVYVLNCPMNDHADRMINSLTVGPKVRRFKRLAMPEILDFFNNTNDCFPIFVSYQMNNSLNYTYYETLHYGYPLVHNSPDLDGLGYYYPEMSITKCGEAILDAYKHHEKNVEILKTKTKKYLNRVDPTYPDVYKTFNGFLTSAIVNAHK